MTNLLLDIGNSTVVSAHYDTQIVTEVKRKSIKEFEKELSTIPYKTYKTITVSSVVPELDTQLLKVAPQCYHITHHTIPYLTLNMTHPETVGADRLVNAVAAHKIYKKNCLIVDSGTAITFCHVDQNGTYNGGSIFPGMKIASKALNLYTAKIPLIEVSSQPNLIGKTTEEAVRIGLYYGYIQLLNGMIKKYRKTLKDITVIGTGNGLEILKNHIDLDFFDPDLTLKGLSFCHTNKV